MGYEWGYYNDKVVTPTPELSDKLNTFYSLLYQMPNYLKQVTELFWAVPKLPGHYLPSNTLKEGANASPLNCHKTAW